MAKNNALDRLTSIMQSNQNEDLISDLDQSEIEDDYFADVENAISSSKKEVEIAEEFDASYESDTAAEETFEEEESSEEADELPEIEINVTDTGEDTIETLPNEGLFNNNTDEVQPKPRGKGGRKKKVDTIPAKPKAVESSSAMIKDSSSNPLYDQLAKRFLTELKTNKVTHNGFDYESMEVLYKYMLSKF